MSSKHLLGLVNDVLDMSKIESGKLTLSTEQISLKEVVEGIVSIMQFGQAQKAEFLTSMHENILRKTWVRRHPTESGVLLNLLSNASKYTPEEVDTAFSV